MKKKGRIFGTISALAISTALMTVGVMAASQVSLNVNSSVSFQATGVYVKVNGQIQQGDSTSNLTNATEPENSDYTYIGYSYTPVTAQTESGTTATTYDDTPTGSVSNEAMPAWTIGEISFDETNKVIRYNFDFKNYSEFTVNATITNYSQAVEQTPSLTSVFTSFADSIDVSESQTGGVISIPAKTGAVPGTASYTITLTLKKFNESLNYNIPLMFSFEKSAAVQAPYQIYEQQAPWGTTYKFVDVGQYPQDYVGDEMNQTLKSWYNSEKPKSVDSYTVYNPTGQNSLASEKYITYHAYTYTDGKTYVRVPATNVSENNAVLDESFQPVEGGVVTYSNGATVVDNVEAWFEVQPIKWRILTQEYDGGTTSYLLSEQTLASSCFYIDRNASQANNYAKSDNYLRDYLTNVFYQDAFSSTDISKIVGRNLTEEDLYPLTKQGSTKVMLSDQKVFAPTYNDMLTAEYGFTTTEVPDSEDFSALDRARIKSPTDFAIANYVLTANVPALSEYLGTMDRPDGCVENFFYTCSSVYSASGACIVGTYGYVDGVDNVGSSDAGVCPALLFNL